MDMSEITAMISTVGFPIATAVILFMTVRYMFDKYTNDVQIMNESYRQVANEFAEAFNKNTIVLQQLTDKLDVLTDRREKYYDDGK